MTGGHRFVVTNTNDSGTGSLRQAILNANANPGLDTITFDIPGTGVQTISPASALPTITDPVVIDGYTQPGASPNTLAVGDNAVLLIDVSGAISRRWRGWAGHQRRGLHGPGPDHQRLRRGHEQPQQDHRRVGDLAGDGRRQHNRG